jgi:hypothetical protein
MADTGPPWNIPYVEPADLVRAYPAADEAQALAIAAGLSAAGNAGIGSNVVQTVKTDDFSTTSTSLVDVTGLAVTITPSTDTSLILVMFQLPLSSTTLGIDKVQLVRGSTNIMTSTGTAPSTHSNNIREVSAANGSVPVTSIFLDAPAVDTATTYKLQVSAGSGTLYVGRNASNNASGTSSITVIEVAV